MTDPLAVLGGLLAIVVLAEALVRSTPLAHFGTALLVIVLGAVAGNSGLLPAGSTAAAPVPVYDGVFRWLAPLAIFWLLLAVNLRDVLRAGVPLVSLSVIAALGTLLGVVTAFMLTGVATVVGPDAAPLGGMFVGTYTGGSINFAAVATEYGVLRNGLLYGTALVVDNVLTAVWMVATILLPRLLGAGSLARARDPGAAAADPRGDGRAGDVETVGPLGLALTGALGCGAVAGADALRTWLDGQGLDVPSILIVTTFALVLAQLPVARHLRGAQALGMLAVYLFLTVIGAFCDLGALDRAGELGLALLLFAGIVIAVHALVTFLAARLLGLDAAAAAVVSQANVGGGASALALARGLGRTDLALPAILLGALGNGLGTYLGVFAAARVLPPLL